MTKRTVPADLPDLAALLDSWHVALKSANKAPTTISSYLRCVNLYLRWCEQGGHPQQLTRAQVELYTSEILAEGKEANTARLRQASLRAFSKWLTYEDELPTDPLVDLRPTQIPTKVVHALSDDQLRALVKACQGKTMKDRRDEAIVRLMYETGLRAAEVVALQMTDIDVNRGVVTVTRGKGGKGRVAPFSPQTAAALDRYQRARRGHKLADTTALWVGVGGKQFGYGGLNEAMRQRAKIAGIEGFHLHLMRHTAATRWLKNGGSESALMSIAGWKTRDMIDRYTGASASERAIDEAREKGLLRDL